MKYLRIQDLVTLLGFVITLSKPQTVANLDNSTSTVANQTQKLVRKIALSKTRSCLANVYYPDCKSWMFYNEHLLHRDQPTWFTNQVLLLEVDYVCDTPQVCDIPNAADIELLNSKSLSADNISFGDYQQFCEAYPKHAVAVFLASHHHVFSNINSTITMGATETTGQAHVFGFVVAYAVMLQLCALLFGLHVMKKALQEPDSHILVYHKTLVAADILLSLLSFLQTTHLMGIALLPVCFISKYVAVYFDQYMFDQLGIATTLIELVYLFATLLQAAMAFDRTLSVYQPALYRKFVTKKKAIALVLTCVSINTAVGVYLVLSHRGDIAGGQVYSSMSFVLSRYSILGSLFIIYCSIQLSCCIATAAKVWSNKQNPIAQENPSLLPCCLLLGTCGISMIGCVLEIHFCFMTNRYNQSYGAADAVNLAFLQSYTDYRHCLLSLLNSFGVGIHCLVSRQYRSEAAAAIARIYRRASSVFIDPKQNNMIAPAAKNGFLQPPAVVDDNPFPVRFDARCTPIEMVELEPTGQ